MDFLNMTQEKYIYYKYVISHIFYCYHNHIFKSIRQ